MMFLEFVKEVFSFFKDLVDNDTLIIVSLLLISMAYASDPEIVKIIVAGFVGYMGGKSK